MTMAISETKSPLDTSRDRVAQLVVGLLGAGFVLWVVSLFTIDITKVNDLGFASVFTPLTWFALFLAVTASTITIFLASLTPRRFWRLMVAALLLVIAVIHATPMLLESAPRFFEAYNHVGFIDYIARTGQHSVEVNNRLSWFGSFGAGATLSGTAGPPSLFGAIRVFPWLFAMVILFPIHSILSKFIADHRARAAAIFLAMGTLSVLIGRRSREIRILGVLSIAPFIFLGATGYGGEALMRALFFALPFLSGLAGILLLRVKPRKVAVVVLAIALSFLATMTEVARYGNEKFEQISADQLAIMQSFYEVAPVDSKILYFGNAMPLYFTNIANYTTNYMCYFNFTKAGPKGKYADQDILRQTGIYAPDIIVWTPEAAVFSSHVYHFKKGWDKPLLKYLTAEGRGTLVVNRPDIKIISFDPSWKPKPGVFLSHE